MGGCATKPKVDDGKAPAPVTDEKVVAEDVHATSSVTREIVSVEEQQDDRAVSRKQSLSNLLNQVAEGKDKPESSNEDKSLEKVAEILESPKQEHPSDSVVAQQVPTEAVGKSVGLKPELANAEVTKLHVPNVETLKLSEADAKVIAQVPKTLTLETPKTSEVTKTESLKPTEVTKVKEAVTVTALKLDTPKPSEVTKTEDVPPVVVIPKSEILKPSIVTKTDNAAASVTQKTDTLESANSVKEVDAKTLKPEESSAETKSKVGEK